MVNNHAKLTNQLKEPGFSFSQIFFAFVLIFMVYLCSGIAIFCGYCGFQWCIEHLHFQGKNINISGFTIHQQCKFTREFERQNIHATIFV